MPRSKPVKVFVSYAWGDDKATEWVRALAVRLQGDGIDVILDQWHTSPGDHLAEFMERAVRTADFVLVVCSRAYKAKTDERAGGVGYEGTLMTGEVLATQNHRKFIPILRDGAWAEAAPFWLIGKRYLDFSTPSRLKKNYPLLLDALGAAPSGPEAAAVVAPSPPASPAGGAEPATAPRERRTEPAGAVEAGWIETSIMSPFRALVSWYAITGTKIGPERATWTTTVHRRWEVWRPGERIGPFRAFLVLIDEATREPISLVAHTELVADWAAPHGTLVEEGEPLTTMLVRADLKPDATRWSSSGGPIYSDVLKFAPALSDQLWRGDGGPRRSRVWIFESTFQRSLGTIEVPAPSAGTFHAAALPAPGDLVGPHMVLGQIRHGESVVPVAPAVAGSFVGGLVGSGTPVYRGQALFTLRVASPVLIVRVSLERGSQGWHTLHSLVAGRFLGGIKGSKQVRGKLHGKEVRIGAPICAVQCGELTVAMACDVEGTVMDVIAAESEPVEVGQPLLEIKVQRLVVRAPMFGDFYRASEPGAPPFVEVGDRVRSGQVVCLLEALKIKNEIESEVDGVVEEIFPHNGQPVGWQDPLIRVRLD